MQDTGQSWINRCRAVVLGLAAGWTQTYGDRGLMKFLVGSLYRLSIKTRAEADLCWLVDGWSTL